MQRKWDDDEDVVVVEQVEKRMQERFMQLRVLPREFDEVVKHMKAPGEDETAHL